MKKSFVILPVLLGSFALLSGERNTRASAEPNLEIDIASPLNLPGETIEWPAAGTIDEASSMRSIWNGANFGFKRLDDSRVAVTGASGWGFRCDYGPKTFGRDRFEVSLDLTDFTRGDCLGLSFGPQGIYNGEAAQGLCMDIIKYSFEERPNDYMVCLNTGAGTAHNETIDGWGDKSETWLDSYKGVVITAENNILNIGWTVTGDNVEIYANDYKATFPVDTLFKNLSEEFCVNFCSGYQSGERHFIVNHCMDGDDMAYYNQDTGLYYEAKSSIENFVDTVSKVTLNTVQDFIDAYSLTEDIDLSALYDYDEIYLRRTFDPAIEGLQSAAVAKFGNATYVELLRYYVNQLSALAADLSDDAALLSALSKVDMVNTINQTISELTLTSEEQADVDAINTTFNEDYAEVQEAAGSRYSDIVNGVIEQMNNATTLEEVREAEIAYNTISTTFRGYMDESAVAALEESLAAARETFSNKFGAVSENSGYVSGESVRVVETEDSIGLTAWGSISTASDDGSGLLYTREALDLIDLSVEYTIDHFGQYAISIMSEPTFFSSADDESVQGFKGFVFLIRDLNETQASVEPYLIDGTCNRFFDGQLSQTQLVIQKSGAIKFEMSLRQINTSGIVENYLEFSFNGAKYETPLVREFDVLGAFPNGKGYFGIGSQSGDYTNPMSLTLNKINGNNATADSLLNADISYAPTASAESFDFTLGGTNNLIIGVDPKLQTGLKFYVDGTQLTVNEHYTYQRNTTLTLKASYLNTLSAGQHVLKLESAKGSSEITLNIVKAAVEDPDPDTSDPGTTNPDKPGDNGKGLGAGAIAGIAVGAVAVVAAIGVGAYFISKKRKK